MLSTGLPAAALACRAETIRSAWHFTKGLQCFSQKLSLDLYSLGNLGLFHLNFSFSAHLPKLFIFQGVFIVSRASLLTQMVKNEPAMRETWV